MPTEQHAIARHNVKGTLQQIDLAFELLAKLSTTDVREAEKLRDSMIESLMRSVSDLQKIQFDAR
jgi:hypothetical protein